MLSVPSKQQDENCGQQGNAHEPAPEDSNVISAGMVMEAVSNFYINTHLPGYEFDPASNLYYNAETGYFYDMSKNMYFNISTQMWYSYNSDGTYSAHRAVPWQPGTWSKKRLRRRTIGLFGEDAVKTSFDQNNVDICELLYDLVDKCDLNPTRGHVCKTFYERFEEHDTDSPVTLSSPRTEQDAPRFYYDSDASYHSDDLSAVRELERQNPPCIRLIEVSNNNQLHIVTVMGSTIGSDVSCDVLLPCDELYVAKKHIQLRYLEEIDDGAYCVECLEKWTLLNGQYIEGGQRYRLDHEDQLQIGNNHFIVHIHHGNNTCRGCEPGLLSTSLNKSSASPQKTKSMQVQRLENIRRMKNEYGLALKDPDYRTKNYSDRSRRRREKVGSDIIVSGSNDVGSGIYSGCSARPVEGASAGTVVLNKKEPQCEDPLSTSNKGFKLLKGMGWKEGSGLGKNEQGIVGPVTSTVRKDRQGLGSQSNSTAAEPPMNKKQRMMDVTRRRFEEASAKDRQFDQE